MALCAKPSGAFANPWRAARRAACTFDNTQNASRWYRNRRAGGAERRISEEMHAGVLHRQD
jgi:hypothetical protein